MPRLIRTNTPQAGTETMAAVLAPKPKRTAKPEPKPEADILATFGNTIDQHFGAKPDGTSRGEAVVGNMIELENAPVQQRVYSTLASLAIIGKQEGHGGAVVHFRLAEALSTADLQGHKPYEVCLTLEANGLLRSGRSKGKGVRLWFVSDLMDAPTAKIKAKTANPVGSLVDALMASAKR